MKLVKVSITVAIIVLLLYACGSGSGSGGGGGGVDDGSGERTLLKGQFIDTAVEGLTYTASPSGLTGTTDADGMFDYQAGDNIEFFLGDISLGSAQAASMITPVHLVAEVEGDGVDETHEAVINITRFLLSLDEDGAPDNGIHIPESIKEAAAGVNLDFYSSTFESDAGTVLAGLASTAAIPAISGSLVSESTAVDHLNQSSLLCGFSGSYEGTWSRTLPDDGDNGVWSFTISPTGQISGNSSSNVFTGQVLPLTGSVTPAGSVVFNAGSADSGSVFTGLIDEDGIISGPWTNLAEETSGNFVGNFNADTAIACFGTGTASNNDNSAGSGGIGDLTMTTEDPVGTVFDAKTRNHNVLGENGSIVWTDYRSFSLGQINRELTLSYDVRTGKTTAILFYISELTTSANNVWIYSLNCREVDCPSIVIDLSDLEVTFSAAEIPVRDNANNLATTPVTLDGTLSIPPASSP